MHCRHSQQQQHIARNARDKSIATCNVSSTGASEGATLSASGLPDTGEVVAATATSVPEHGTADPPRVLPSQAHIAELPADLSADKWWPDGYYKLSYTDRLECGSFSPPSLLVSCIPACSLRFFFLCSGLRGSKCVSAVLLLL